MNAADLTIWLVAGAGIVIYITVLFTAISILFILYYRCVYPRFKRKSWDYAKISDYTYSIFMIGFSVIFYALGLSVSWIGITFSSNQKLIQQIGGIFIVLMGLFMTGLFQPKWLMAEKRCSIEVNRLDIFARF